MKLLLEQAINNDSGQILIRTKLRAVSRRMGFSGAQRERIELVYNEMVTNAIKYAHSGGLMQIWETEEPYQTLDLFILDYGPGIPDLNAAIEDGFTTAKSMGKGLGAILRLAHESEFYSLPPGRTSELKWQGTAIWARFHSDIRVMSHAHQQGTFMRAFHDDAYTGDRLRQVLKGKTTRWLHMDALGHGREASETLHSAEELLDLESPLLELMDALDQRLRGGRGAVGMLCELNAATESLAFCGVGDMVAYLMVNHIEKQAIPFTAGILGQTHKSITLNTLPFPPHALLLTASDGMRQNWVLNNFPGLWRLHPQMITLLLGLILGKGNDDKSIFAIRNNPNTGVNHVKKTG